MHPAADMDLDIYRKFVAAPVERDGGVEGPLEEFPDGVAQGGFDVSAQSLTDI